MSPKPASFSRSELRRLQQAAFLEPDDKRLSPPAQLDSTEWATHLAYISAQEPGNLLNHVRRIYLHLACKQTHELFGAMLDLHLVLGDKGAQLRHRLLGMTGKLLSREMQAFFITHQQSGVLPQQPLPASRYSVLGNFFTGGLRLVTPQKSEDQPSGREIDPLELAREELNYGDISVAQQILEEALLRAPKRLGLHYGLLEIYKHTQSLEDLLAMQDRLGDDIAIARTAWNQMIKALEAKGR